MSEFLELEDVREMDGFYEVLEALKKINLFGEPEITKEDVKEESIEKLRKVGLEEFIDEESLDQAIDEAFEIGTKKVSIIDVPDLKNGLDFEEVIENEAETEVTLDTDIFQLRLITVLMDLTDAKTIARTFVERGYLDQSPMNPMIIDDLKDDLHKNIDITFCKLMSEAVKSHFKEDEKITFEPLREE